MGSRDVCGTSQARQSLRRSIDYNKLQSDDRNEDIMRLEPLAAKWRAFEWAVAEIDGHDLRGILSAFTQRRCHARPPAPFSFAHTIKGKGVPYMENMPQWHGSVKLTREQAEDALKALQALFRRNQGISRCQLPLKHPH